MDVTFRPATRDDIPDLARPHVMAGHGLFDALYHDTIPGLSTSEIYERVLARPEPFWSYASITVATNGGRVVGEVHSCTFDETVNGAPDPLIPKDRLVIYEPFGPLGALGAGSYYIKILSVYPEFRSKDEMLQFSGDLL